MKTLFKYSNKDVFLVGQTVLALVLAITMAIANLDIFWYLVIAPFHIMLILGIQNTSLHHHTHWATFSNKKLNQFYELLISAVSGLKPQMYRILHSIHHKYVNDTPINGETKDLLSVFAKGTNGNVENAWTFCFRRAVIAWTDPWKYVFRYAWMSERHNLPMINYVLWRRETIAFVSFIALLLCLNFYYGIWYLFVINFIAHFLNYSWHYGEHYGSYHYRGDTTQDSVGIYNKWYNTLCFNSGLHQEHHHRPGLHWTRLHELTPTLPTSRVTASGMHIFNVPWIRDLKALWR